MKITEDIRKMAQEPELVEISAQTAASANEA
jgi:hypothetical protein